MVQNSAAKWHLTFIWTLIIIKNTTQVTLSTALEANVIMFNNETLQIKVRWKPDGTIKSKYDVVITPLSKIGCHEKSCVAYGLPENTTEIILPTYTTSKIEHDECTIDAGCEYSVKVTGISKVLRKTNVTVIVPDCVGTICSCRHRIFLPTINTTAIILTNNSINVTWVVHPQNNSENWDIPHNVRLHRVCIRVYVPGNPSLAWGGPPKILKHICDFIGIIPLPSIHETVDGSTEIHFDGDLIPGISLMINARVADNRGCEGVDSLPLKLNITSAKNESRQALESSSPILTIVIPLILVGFGAACIIHFYMRRQKKANSVANWRSIYRNVPTGGLRPISMEDNFLYLDKDILDAQEKGKADTFEIPHSSLHIGYEIGKGAFGRVFKATAQNLLRIPGPTIVAVKQLKKRPTADEVEEFLGEIQTMKNVGRHENVVSLLGCCTIKEPLMMIMEYVGHGDLLQYLRNVRRRHLESSRLIMTDGKTQSQESQNSFHINPLHAPQGKYLELRLSSSSATSEGSYITQPDMNPSGVRPSVTETTYTMLSHSQASSASLDFVLDNNELHNFAIQISRGMRHLEERGITHRDLAARNILIDERKTLKISDFGLSRPGIYVNTRNKKLPLRWLSIEAIRDNLYSSKSDVWAFGIVLWEIGTLGGFPYPTTSNHELLPFLSSGKRLERPEICAEELYKLMLNCWNEDPDQRPSFKEILKWLQPQHQKIYVDFRSLGPDYVFPPTREQVLETNSKPTPN